MTAERTAGVSPTTKVSLGADRRSGGVTAPRSGNQRRGEQRRSPALRASALGHDPRDSTAILQAALDSAIHTVVIDNVPGGWTSGPLFVNRDNLHIVFEPGTTLRAKRGAFAGRLDCQLTLDGHRRIRISGYGATLEGCKAEYDDDSQHRMSICLLRAADVVVEGLTIRESGGDAVYVGRAFDAHPGDTSNLDPTQGAAWSSNIVLRDLTCVNSLRQAITVISCNDLRIEGCSLEDANGSQPQSGIAMRPNHPDEQLTGVVIRDCRIHGNLGSQVLIDGSSFTKESAPIDVLIDQCLIGSLDYSPPQSLITLRAGFRGAVDLQGSVLVVGRRSRAVAFESANVSNWDWGHRHNSSEVIPHLTLRTCEAGAISLQDCVLLADHSDIDGPPAAAREDPEVEISAVCPQAQAGRPALVRFRRLDASTEQPQVVGYTTSGTAKPRRDHGGLANIAVIPAGEPELVLPIRTFRGRHDHTLVVSGTGSAHAVGSAAIAIVNSTDPRTAH